MDRALSDAVARSSVLSRLAAADRDDLLACCVARHYRPGAPLYRMGEPARAFFLVAEGAVRLSVSGHGHAAFIGETMGPGGLAGAESVLDRGVYETDAHAVPETVAFPIDAGPFLDSVTSRFELVLSLMAGTSARLRGLVQDITELKLQSTTRRLAGYLVRLAGGAAGPARVVLPCEKHVLAERLGMQPESLSRAFAKLRPLGVHAGRIDAVDIDDIAALQRFAQTDAPSWTG